MDICDNFCHDESMKHLSLLSTKKLFNLIILNEVENLQLSPTMAGMKILIKQGFKNFQTFSFYFS